MLKKLLFSFPLALCVSTAGAYASTITFTAAGVGTDGALSASAGFVTSAGQIQIVLTNTLAASVIRSAGQALSDVTFTLSNAAGTVGTAFAAGQQGNVSSTGVVTYTTGGPGRFIGIGGGQYNVAGSTVTLEAIGGGQPSEMIAPSIANGGTYTNVNNGFQNFDPYTIGPATITLALSGVTANTTVTSAIFSFGTGPDTFLPGTPTVPSVPEPSSLLLLGTGALSGAGLLRRRFAA